MTTSGIWRIDDSRDYKVHNYSNGSGWANIIQDGTHDSFDYMVYRADGSFVACETGLTEDEAMRRAQEAVDAK